MSSIFNELKNLTQAGASAKASVVDTSSKTAAPAPVAAVPAATPDEPPAAAAAAAPAPAASNAEPTVVPFVPEVVAPKGTQLFDSSNQLRGTLMPDGKFIAVDVEADPLAHLSEADRAEINWDDEKRVDLPQRSAGRIQWLLRFETEQQTKARIANDIHRALFARPRSEFDPEDTAVAKELKRWIQ